MNAESLCVTESSKAAGLGGDARRLRRRSLRSRSSCSMKWMPASPMAKAAVAKRSASSTSGPITVRLTISSIGRRWAVRVVDMLAAHIGAGGGDAASLRRHRLDDLVRVERVADADHPVVAFRVPAAASGCRRRRRRRSLRPRLAAIRSAALRMAQPLTMPDGSSSPVRPADVEIAVRSRALVRSARASTSRISGLSSRDRDAPPD